jgi:hypothetical protein
MPEHKKISEDILWSEWWELLKEYGACEKPEEYSKWDKYTLKETLEIQLNRKESLDYEPWAIWALNNIYDRITDYLRLKFIEKIMDPAISSSLYCDNQNFNRDELDELRKKFKNKLPYVEKYIKERGIDNASN